MEQLSLLNTVLNEYAEAGDSIDNASHYERVSSQLNIDADLHVHPVGKAQPKRIHKQI